ncbi:hypothetical protein FSP39_014559 [Pinctada imbricata]|uniref:Carboxypeptidase n=1 Tax=Pinctada imbricata TaxID=66713 RepID=A0AA88XYW9_PINIB|nr:hypothetical protein FSP39_014559 [Pinctada imbricata]
MRVVIFLCLLVGVRAAPVEDEVTLPLPGLSVKLPWKHYSGYLNGTGDRKLHYWFIQSANPEPEYDPLVLWLNGGPGCSSLAGLLLENGPFLVANMLYLESPVGVGYSYTNEPIEEYTDSMVAMDNYKALTHFYKKFPELKGNELFMVGESYGGYYVPTLSELILNDFNINFKGFAVGNGILDQDWIDTSMVYFFYGHGMVAERYTKWKQSYWKRIGLPGPEPTPFIGTLGLLRKKGIWKHTLECKEKYGKVFGTYFGNIPTINIADADLVKELLIKRFSTFPNRHTSPAIASCCDKLVDNIKEQSKDGKEVIEMKHVFGCFTLDVIASTAFGIDVDSQKDTENEFVKQAKKAFSGGFTSKLLILTIMFPIFNRLLNLLQKINIVATPFRQTFAFFKKVALSIIEERKSGNEQKPKDLMQIMLNAHNEDIDKEDEANMVDYKEGDSTKRRKGLTLDEVVANTFIFFVAGYDTTANTLSFLAYNLAMNPECQDKCIEEVDRVLGEDKPGYDNVLKLQYLDNCLNETLRMYAPAAVANRHVEEDCDIRGYKVPKGAGINICIYAIHHDPEYWPEPYKFDPDRFSTDEKRKHHPYAFLPFGHGPRNCIGMRLAQLEAKAAMASVLQKYRFVKCTETEDPVVLAIGTFLLCAENGIKLRVQQRRK